MLLHAEFVSAGSCHVLPPSPNPFSCCRSMAHTQHDFRLVMIYRQEHPQEPLPHATFPLMRALLKLDTGHSQPCKKGGTIAHLDLQLGQTRARVLRGGPHKGQRATRTQGAQVGPEASGHHQKGAAEGLRFKPGRKQRLLAAKFAEGLSSRRLSRCTSAQPGRVGAQDAKERNSEQDDQATTSAQYVGTIWRECTRWKGHASRHAAHPPDHCSPRWALAGWPGRL